MTRVRARDVFDGCPEPLLRRMSAAPILALDPSSTVLGWAAMRGPELVDAGAVRAMRGAPSLARIDELADRACRLLIRFDPEVVVVEVPSGVAGRGSTAGATGHLAIYGMAVGAIRASVRHMLWRLPGGPHRAVIAVDECDWTRGRPKGRRAAITRMEHPGLDWDADGGHDMADAIGIGRWLLDQATMRAVDLDTNSHDAGSTPAAQLLDMAAERRQASLAEARGVGGHHDVSEALRREALTLELAASTIRRETQEAMR